jgi:putative pyruvate formate lyase activating enzyme
MKQSRRQFVKSCLYLVTSGFSSAFICLCAGCRKVGGKAKTAVDFEPAYLSLHKSKELKKRAEELWNIMKSCKLCPRKCETNRLEGNKGFCQASSQLEIAAYNPHFGEEKPLVGKGGSGTIFFTNCSLRCVFCINWQISQGGRGKPRTIEELAQMMLSLQEMGCHNINFVTPDHYVPHILLAVDIAAGKGLRLPLVYNTCGWMNLEIAKKLDGIIDIYLPDFKYSSSGAQTYPEAAKAALLEMHRQVGVAKPAADGLIYRGLMIRHLVMPNNVAGTKQVIEWIANNLPKDTYLNIMSQYRPMYKAFDYPEISRRITPEEYNQAVKWAKNAGLTNLDIQGTPLWRNIF